MAAPYVVKLQTATVSGSSASTISFTNIDQSYAHLWVVGSLRSDRASVASSVGCYMNSDTSSGNYDYARYYYYSSLSANPSRDGTSGWLCGYMPAANAGSGTFGTLEMYIANYAVSGRHYYGTKSGFGDPTASSQRLAIVGTQHAVSTTISSITFDDRDTGNFVVGSTLTLYGLKDS